jgi:sulfite exporter TauE/SafE
MRGMTSASLSSLPVMAARDIPAPIGSTADLRQALGPGRRLAWIVGAIAIGTVIAGLWNYHLADGFGRDVVAANTVGDTSVLSTMFGQLGLTFGFAFAWVAGLAATFTACNCVVFAMLPGLAATGDRAASRAAGLRALATFAAGVILVGASYGVFIGFLGPNGAQAFNTNEVRLAQAQAVFTVLGTVMLIWGLIEFRVLDGLVNRLSPLTRAFFSQPQVRAGFMGLLVGAFAIGRPYPVFRDLLNYAAAAHSPIYGALLMMLQGVGQITVMVALFLILLFVFGKPLSRWVRSKPHQPVLVTAIALVAGGSYFIYYWNLSFLFNIGGWGFKLGWYQ